MLAAFWKRGRATIRDVHGDLVAARALAYTTIATVVARLTAKKLLRRERNGVAFTYEPAVAPEVIVSPMLEELIGVALSGDMRPLIDAVKRHQDRLTPADRADLEKIVKALRNGAATK